MANFVFKETRSKRVQPHSICEHFFNFQSIYLDYVYEDVSGAGRQPGLSCTHSPPCLLGLQGEGLLVLSSESLVSLSELGMSAADGDHLCFVPIYGPRS